MAKAVEMLALLQDKPLESVFVNDYFLGDKLLNVMEFSSAAVHSNANNLKYTVVRNVVDGVDYTTAVRKWGEDYASKNSKQEEDTFTLSVLGGKYTVDATLDEVVGKIVTENEAREKMNMAVNAFNHQFIKGNGTNGQMLGLEKYCKDNKMTIEEVFNLDRKITQGVAEEFLEVFNDVLSELNVDANVIICSKKMESKLQTIQSVLKKYTETAKIERLNYKQFLDMPVVGIDNTIGLGAEDDSAFVEDIYIARIDTANGIFCASPADKTAFVKVEKPVVITGSPIKTGYVDFATCPIIKNKKALRRFRVKTATI